MRVLGCTAVLFLQPQHVFVLARAESDAYLIDCFLSSECVVSEERRQKLAAGLVRELVLARLREFALAARAAASIPVKTKEKQHEHNKNAKRVPANQHCLHNPSISCVEQRNESKRQERGAKR